MEYPSIEALMEQIRDWSEEEDYDAIIEVLPRRDDDFENRTPFYGVDVHFTIDLWFTIKLCGSLDHVHLLF